MEGAVVSRSDLYKEEDVETEARDQVALEYPPVSFTFEEVRHESPEPEKPTVDATDLLEFQFIGGAQPVRVNLDEKEEEVKQKRPMSYYIYSPSPMDRARILQTAVSGNFVLEEAEALARLAARNPIAKDVNADWKPAKKRCRPSKKARVKKRERNERIEAEQKAEAEQAKQRQRPYKPRGMKRPKTGFTFK